MDVLEDSVEEVPVDDDGQVEAGLKVEVPSFQLFPFLVVRVAVVVREDLIEERYDCVDEGYEEPGIVEGKETSEEQ